MKPDGLSTESRIRSLPYAFTAAVAILSSAPFGDNTLRPHQVNVVLGQKQQAVQLMDTRVRPTIESKQCATSIINISSRRYLKHRSPHHASQFQRGPHRQRRFSPGSSRSESESVRSPDAESGWEHTIVVIQRKARTDGRNLHVGFISTCSAGILQDSRKVSRTHEMEMTGLVRSLQCVPRAGTNTVRRVGLIARFCFFPFSGRRGGRIRASRGFLSPCNSRLSRRAKRDSCLFLQRELTPQTFSRIRNAGARTSRSAVLRQAAEIPR